MASADEYIETEVARGVAVVTATADVEVESWEASGR